METNIGAQPDTRTENIDEQKRVHNNEANVDRELEGRYIEKISKNEKMAEKCHINRKQKRETRKKKKKNDRIKIKVKRTSKCNA